MSKGAAKKSINVILIGIGLVGNEIINQIKKLDNINIICLANSKKMLYNENGDEECINLAFILLAKELILGVIPEEYRDLELLNSMSKADIKQNLLPKLI